METVVSQKAEAKKKSQSSLNKVTEAPSSSETDLGNSAGMPLFLQRSAQPSSPQSPLTKEPELVIGQPENSSETDADHVAVIAQSDSTKSFTPSSVQAPDDSVQRKFSQAESSQHPKKTDSAIPKQIQTEEEPGQILEQLKSIPPSNICNAYDEAVTVSPNALEGQKQQLQQNLPQIPSPTGLPAKEESSQVNKGQVGIASNGVTEPKAGFAKAGTDFSGKAAKAEPVQVKEAPPLSFIPIHLVGGETSKIGESDNSDPQLAQSSQNALESVQLGTDQVNTKAGTSPVVYLTDDANPVQMDMTQQNSDQAVNQGKVKTAQQMNRDFGENRIFPDTDTEILKSEKVLSAIQPTTAKGDKAPTIPLEIIGELNESLGPTLQEKLSEQQQQYAVGKQKFDDDTVQAKADADKDVKNLTQETAQQQLQQQQQAKEEISQHKQDWKTEIDKTENAYQSDAKKATQDQKKKITEEKQKGENDAAQLFAKAEQDAELKKQTAEQEAGKKKQETKKESTGFWGWAKSKVNALIDGLKKAINFIYDNLRKAVKFIFEQAKKLALAAIELARKVIVGLIQGLGEILKGFVKIAFAAFPEIANKINAKIDRSVNTAVKAVNTAADLLKKGVAAILDFLANTLDSLLGLIQSLYNGILTVVGMIVRGEFGELLKRLGDLVDAAKAAPPQFETAGYEELLGGNLDEPLSPAELAQAGVAPSGVQIGSNGQIGTTDEMPKPPWSEANIGVDGVEQNMELSPEMSAELMQQPQEGGLVELAEATDGDRTMNAVMAEATGEKAAGGKAEESHEPKHPDDGLSPKQRAEIRWQLMKQGISKWWSDNWPKVLIGATAAIGGFIALNVVTGGAITAALPAIMSVVGPLFIGASIAQIGGHVQGYLTQAWDGNIQGGGKSLAKGLAAGAIELVSYLTFKAGSAAIKGAKAVAKGAAKGAQALAKGAVRLAKGAANLIAKGAKFLIEKGKVLFKGIAGSGLGKQFNRLRELGEALLNRMRFKKFRIRLGNNLFVLEGYINPWIPIATLKLPKEGKEIFSDVTRKGQNKAQRLFENSNDAKNWAKQKLGNSAERIYDESGKWIGWENKAGDRVYWGHGDWGKGVGLSNYPHLNYEIGGVKGHFFLKDKMINRGEWNNFAKEITSEIIKLTP